MGLLSLIPLKDWLYCGVIAALLIAFGAYTLHERHLGAADCKADVAAQVQKQDIHNAEVHASDVQTVNHEAQAYANAVASPVVRPVRVYVNSACPVAVPAAPGTGPSPDAAPASGAADHGGSVPPQSFGPELQAIGQRANAQIAGLQDYISKVCRPAK